MKVTQLKEGDSLVRVYAKFSNGRRASLHVEVDECRVQKVESPDCALVQWNDGNGRIYGELEKVRVTDTNSGSDNAIYMVSTYLYRPTECDVLRATQEVFTKASERSHLFPTHESSLKYRNAKAIASTVQVDVADILFREKFPRLEVRKKVAAELQLAGYEIMADRFMDATEFIHNLDAVLIVAGSFVHLKTELAEVA